MRKFDPSPEGRNRYLRILNRKPLEEQALEVLGKEGPALITTLKAVYTDLSGFEGWARNILRRCGKLTSKKQRKEYVASCIRREQRRAELWRWLEDHPDPDEFMEVEEIRMITKAERSAYYEKLVQVELELGALGGSGGGVLLIERLGYEQAMEQLWRLINVFGIRTDAEQGRVSSICMNAARSSTRYPALYVARVIENEKRSKRR